MAQSKSSSDSAVAPKNFYIFGSGISFSISPTIHNAGFLHYDLPHKYAIRESTSIDEVAGLILDEQFGGASVTMPHKLHVHKLCTDQTETARLIGAINTLIVNHNGNERIITGDNTDWSGLHRIIPTAKGRPCHWSRGASRAALYAMHRAGLQHIYLVNRTPATAEKVKQDFNSVFKITVLRSLHELPQNPDVIVGTVPAETTNESQFVSIFGPRGLCIDMSYKPRQTPLLTVARRNEGWSEATGVDVLLAQAYDQFYLWTGCEPPRGKMIEAIAEHERGKAKVTTGGSL
ncbi:shikimate / quinate 5-dehydrogenase protein [Penicillium canariense]|uniref:Shikimate / quinate 5-dehydrogenase protein n=1 Tax=Penicillium canariense TaxID=189055 RepID=A0A9W9IHP9_9EURO|nr:shikimate / quinate 5-dehydrogenase protein [Penicillium canariense]KAJ5175846.1 shikimate / quinate 5-dehydrogenase protein [Penicillium canariense]